MAHLPDEYTMLYDENDKDIAKDDTLYRVFVDVTKSCTVYAKKPRPVSPSEPAPLPTSCGCHCSIYCANIDNGDCGCSCYECRDNKLIMRDRIKCAEIRKGALFG